MRIVGNILDLGIGNAKRRRCLKMWTTELQIHRWFFVFTSKSNAQKAQGNPRGGVLSFLFKVLLAEG